MFRYDRLDELVKESGKKKKYLCSKIGKCPTYLRDAKKQNTNIKDEDLEILAFELNTTPEYLSGETDVKEKLDTVSSVELSEIELIFSQLTPSRQTKLLELARLYLDDQHRTEENQ